MLRLRQIRRDSRARRHRHLPRAIVISHGFTEFAEKYDELVWYFLLAGYSVCVLEHRGHGKSARDVDNRCMVWIDDWQRYVADLAGFAETIGQQYAAGMPLNLFCHSMGGGIGAAVLERYPTLFDKAVLSAPMIAPATGMPLGVARVLVGALCGLGFGKKRVFGQSGFTPEFSMEGNEGASKRVNAGTSSCVARIANTRPTARRSNGCAKR